jgi:glycolate oxidase FAD binding subunit
LVEEFATACPAAVPREPTAADAVDGLMPEVVTYPTSNDQVGEIVRLAGASDRTVVVRGSGTKIDWAGTPSSAQVVVDLSRMASILEHASGDFVVRVQAGCRLADLNRELGEVGQWVPVDEVVPGSTVGGVIATGICGPSRYLYGAVRDLLIGVTVVRADGVVARSGSKVVKNVAGYDLAKLFTGSYGTLGVITEAILRLRPLPALRRYLTATYADETVLAPALADVLRSQEALTAVELECRMPQGVINLSVLVEGRAEPAQERAQRVRGMLGSPDFSDDPPDGWGALPGPVTLKLTAELRSVPALLALVRLVAGAHNLDVVVRGSAGVGVLFAGLGEEVPPARLQAFLSELRKGCDPLGGRVVVLRAPGKTKAAVDIWGPVAGLELMRRLKQQFDPNRILAPGRFVGGI